MKSFIAVLTITVFSILGMGFSVAAEPEFHEGFEYTKVIPPQPTQVEKGQVEVVELFWYGCPSCFRFEPSLNKWLKSKPKNVKFLRIPAQLNPSWTLHAKAFYVAQLLKVGDKIHAPFFDEIHKNNNSLNSKAKLIQFFKKHGVNEKKFNETFDSFSVQTRIKQSKALVDKYGINGVPTLIINGKYRVSTSNMDSNDAKLIKLINYLVKLESK